MPFISGPSSDPEISTNIITLARDSIYIESLVDIFGKSYETYIRTYNSHVGVIIDNHLYINHPDVYASSSSQTSMEMKIYDIDLYTGTFTEKSHTNIATVSTSVYGYNQTRFIMVSGNSVLCLTGASYGGVLYWYDVKTDAITIISTTQPITTMFDAEVQYSCNTFWSTTNNYSGGATCYMMNSLDEGAVTRISISNGSYTIYIGAYLEDTYTKNKVFVSNRYVTKSDSSTTYWFDSDTTNGTVFNPVWTVDEPLIIPYSTATSHGYKMLDFGCCYKSIPSIPNCWVARNTEYSGGDCEYIVQIRKFNSNTKELEMRLVYIPSGWELYRKDRNSQAVCGTLHTAVSNTDYTPQCYSFNIISDKKNEWYAFTVGETMYGLIPFLTKYTLEDDTL